MQQRILILTPSAHRELEPDFIAAVTNHTQGSNAKVAGAFAYVEKHGADIAAIHPEMSQLDAWAEFAGKGVLPNRSGQTVPVFTSYVVPLMLVDGVGHEVKVGPVNAGILARGAFGGVQKRVYVLLCGEVTTRLVGPMGGLGLDGRDTLRLTVLDDVVASIREEDAKVARTIVQEREE